MLRDRPRPKRVRFAIGVGLLILSPVPWIVAAIMPFIGSSPGTVAASIGGLIVTAEVIGAVVLGQEAYGIIRGKFRRRARQRSDESQGPPSP